MTSGVLHLRFNIPIQLCCHYSVFTAGEEMLKKLTRGFMHYNGQTDPITIHSLCMHTNGKNVSQNLGNLALYHSTKTSHGNICIIVIVLFTNINVEACCYIVRKV